MEKTYHIIYFISFVISFIIILFLITKSNFPKLFKQGQTEPIKVATFLLAFISAGLFALAMKSFLESIFGLIIK